MHTSSGDTCTPLAPTHAHLSCADALAYTPAQLFFSNLHTCRAVSRTCAASCIPLTPHVSPWPAPPGACACSRCLPIHHGSARVSLCVCDMTPRQSRQLRQVDKVELAGLASVARKSCRGLAELSKAFRGTLKARVASGAVTRACSVSGFGVRWQGVMLEVARVPRAMMQRHANRRMQSGTRTSCSAGRKLKTCHEQLSHVTQRPSFASVTTTFTCATPYTLDALVSLPSSPSLAHAASSFVYH